MTTNNRRASRITLLLATVLIAGIYSCNNNAATEKAKADSLAAAATLDSIRVADSARMILPADTTTLPTDTGRETKVPRPPAH